MEIHEVLKKVKESFSSFLIGLVLAVTCSYIVLDKLHSEKLEIVRLEGAFPKNGFKRNSHNTLNMHVYLTYPSGRLCRTTEVTT